MTYQVLWGAVLYCGLSMGQATSNAGDVRGVVLDATGSAIAEAKVTLVNAERGFTRSVVSNIKGDFARPSTHAFTKAMSLGVRS